MVDYKYKRLRISLSKLNEILSETVGKKCKLTVKKRGGETDGAFLVRKTQAIKDHAQALEDHEVVAISGGRNERGFKHYVDGETLGSSIG